MIIEDEGLFFEWRFIPCVQGQLVNYVRLQIAEQEVQEMTLTLFQEWEWQELLKQIRQLAISKKRPYHLFTVNRRCLIDIEQMEEDYLFELVISPNEMVESVSEAIGINLLTATQEDSHEQRKDKAEDYLAEGSSEHAIEVTIELSEQELLSLFDQLERSYQQSFEQS